MRRIWQIACVSCVLTGVAPAAHAEMLVNYNFDDGNNVADFVAANTTASNFNAGSGLTNVDYALSANARGWNPSSSAADAISNSDYWSFTVTAGPGRTLDLSSLTFNDVRGSNGPQNFQVEVNGTLVGPVGTATTSFVGQSYDLTSFVNLTSATIRLLGWNASNNGNSAQWYVDDVTLSGITQTPAPATLVLLASGAISLLGYVRLHRGRNLSAAS